jgi:hypothetical protein
MGEVAKKKAREMLLSDNQTISWFDIPMDQTCSMQEREVVDELMDEKGALVDLEGRGLFFEVAQEISIWAILLAEQCTVSQLDVVESSRRHTMRNGRSQSTLGPEELLGV